MASKKKNKKASRSLAERKAMKGGEDEGMRHERRESRRKEKSEYKPGYEEEDDD
jgi:hypothetical protein